MTARRQITAKLRKEMARKQEAGESANVSAAEQTEQTTVAAVEEVGGAAWRGTVKTKAAVQKRRQAAKEAGDPPVDGTGRADTPPPGRAARPPTPQERMRQKAVKEYRERKELAGRTVREDTGTPGTLQPPVSHEVSGPEPPVQSTAATAMPQAEGAPASSAHYGRQLSPPEATATPRAADPSIHPSITAERPGNGTAPIEVRRAEAIRNAKAGGSAGPAGRPESAPAAQPPQAHSTSPREKPRGGAAPKEKPTGGAFAPKTRQRVERTAATAGRPAKAVPTVSGSKKTAKRITERARHKAQREAQHKTVQGIRRTAKAAVEVGKSVAAATAKAVSALIGALAGLVGGATLVAGIGVVVLVAAVASSPLGILFTNEPTPGTMPLSAAVAQINAEYGAQLEALQAGGYDSIEIHGQPPDWREVMAVFACKTAGAGGGVDVATLDADRVGRLRTVFWDMCAITSEAETVDHPDSDPNDGMDDGYTERILHITVTARTAREMRTAYAFTDYQNEALDALLEELEALGGLLGDLSISQEEAIALLQNLPDDLDPLRREIVRDALSLVGKVNYFWGGKSLTLGWDARWGMTTKVTSPGSQSTGTYRPFGLDCSGFVDWTYYNATDGAYYPGHGGGAYMQHTYCTDIEWSEAQPGDLVFYPDDEHVGIVGGRDGNGNLLIIHCASGHNNVVITGVSGFTAVARPNYLTE